MEKEEKRKGRGEGERQKKMARKGMGWKKKKEKLTHVPIEENVNPVTDHQLTGSDGPVIAHYKTLVCLFGGEKLK